MRASLKDRFEDTLERREVRVVAASAAVALPIDARAKVAIVGIQTDQCVALGICEHGERTGVAYLPERALDRAPVESLNSAPNVLRPHKPSRLHDAGRFSVPRVGPRYPVW